ncbi:Transcriptional regulator TrmB, partial [Candidatus Magnetomorum sp. HK-1]
KKKKLVKKTKESTVLDRVFKVIKRSRKGATVEKIQEATQLDKKQISNSLYKLTKKNMVKTISRGLYVPVED